MVCWKLKTEADGRSKQENLQIAKELLKGLKDKIPEIVRLEAGTNTNATPEAFDLALYCEFETQEALDAYQAHPEHRRAVEFLRKVRDGRVVVDYLV